MAETGLEAEEQQGGLFVTAVVALTISSIHVPSLPLSGVRTEVVRILQEGVVRMLKEEVHLLIR